MDITPQVINEVEFPLKVRGYDPDEVDDFLERMAVGVGQLQERLEELAERAAVAERRAAELEKQVKEAGSARAAGGPAGDRPAMTPVQETEQLSRTLAMAQRFVDQAMKEAQDEADKLVAEATDRSRQMHTQTDVEVERLRNEAQADIADEVRQLEDARASLQGDVEALTRHADDQRARLRASLAEFERLLDDPEGLRTTGGPDVSSAALPEFARRRGAGAAGAPGAADVPSASPPDGGQSTTTDIDRDEPAAAPVVVATSSGDEPQSGETPPAVQEPEDEDEAWSRFAQGPEPVNEGPPTAVHLGQDGGDPYLSELRRAIGHDAPAPGEAGTGPVTPFDQDDDPVPRRRFERR
jgi:DivIVA domain-containing protein